MALLAADEVNRVTDAFLRVQGEGGITSQQGLRNTLYLLNIDPDLDLDAVDTVWKHGEGMSLMGLMRIVARMKGRQSEAPQDNALAEDVLDAIFQNSEEVTKEHFETKACLVAKEAQRHIFNECDSVSREKIRRIVSDEVSCPSPRVKTPFISSRGKGLMKNLAQVLSVKKMTKRTKLLGASAAETASLQLEQIEEDELVDEQEVEAIDLQTDTDFFANSLSRQLQGHLQQLEDNNSPRSSLASADTTKEEEAVDLIARQLLNKTHDIADLLKMLRSLRCKQKGCGYVPPLGHRPTRSRQICRVKHLPPLRTVGSSSVLMKRKAMLHAEISKSKNVAPANASWRKLCFKHVFDTQDQLNDTRALTAPTTSVGISPRSDVRSEFYPVPRNQPPARAPVVLSEAYVPTNAVYRKPKNMSPRDAYLVF